MQSAQTLAQPGDISPPPRSYPLQKTFSRYREARKSLRVPASRQSRLGLDGTNFFVADVQTGFGSFVAFYLAGLGWSQESVGVALTVDGLSAVVGQIPGGALADAVTWKRGLAAIGILGVCIASLILVVAPTFALVFVAQAIHGLASGITTAAIAAISLGLVGRSAMSSRIGRNFEFSAAGNALTAGAMGAIGNYVSKASIFLASGVLCVPALVTLSRIRPNEIDYARARNAGTGEQSTKFHRVLDVGKNRSLVVLAAVLSLFQLADAAMLPALGQRLGHADMASGSMLMSGLIVLPQITVAVLAPWVGYHSERKGRKPLLLIGLGAQVLRASLLMIFDSYPAMLGAQFLDGISGATISVLTMLIITDLTTGTGRFNLARGVVGTLGSIAAAISTSLVGFIIVQFGSAAGFLFMAAAAASAVALTLMLLPETKPSQYLD